AGKAARSVRNENGRYDASAHLGSPDSIGRIRTPPDRVFVVGPSFKILLRPAVEKHGAQVALSGIGKNHDEGSALHLRLAGHAHGGGDGGAAGDSGKD